MDSKKAFGEIRLALETATACHKGQRTIAGEDYIEHPIAVAHFVVEMGHIGDADIADAISAALLHDTMEDCGMTPSRLLGIGFNGAVVAAVEFLTRQKGVQYRDYIFNIARGRGNGAEIARAVKLADLRHNMDLARLPEEARHTKKTTDRMDKYAWARSIIADAL